MTLDDTCTFERVKWGPAVFVIPFYGDLERSAQYLHETVESLFAQTDTNWCAVLIDDASPLKASRDAVASIEKKYAQHITVIRHTENVGQAVCRNAAIHWAYKRKYPLILFNDADDLSHPERLATVREIFLQSPTVDLVYSHFTIIDEFSRPVPRWQIAPGITDILDALERNPVEGYDAWIDIGIHTGFACLPSSTAVRTEIAYQCPFPHYRVSEDSYTWLSIAAAGNEFKFTPSIPSAYRIPSSAEGSSYRSRVGKRAFYEQKVLVDSLGFLKAIDIALKRGRLEHKQVEELKQKFYARLAQTLIKENEVDLAHSLLHASV